jgi:L-galactose dehydrogenase
MRDGRTANEAAELVRRALDLGVTYVDTAPAYGTEQAVGLGIRSLPRAEVTVSTKFRHVSRDGKLRDSRALRRSVTHSLAKLQVEHLDILFLHGVLPSEYPFCAQELLPEMVRLREEGLVRAIGLSESFANDPHHRMQHQALEDGSWDVFMTGFNVLNPSARWLFERASQRGIGTVVMHAARWVLTGTDRLRSHLAGLATGVCSDRRERLETAIERLAEPTAAAAFPSLAYRYCLNTPGVGSVLMGTGDPIHLDANVEAAAAAPLQGEELLQAVLEGLLAGTSAGAADEPASDDGKNR